MNPGKFLNFEFLKNVITSSLTFKNTIDDFTMRTSFAMARMKTEKMKFDEKSLFKTIPGVMGIVYGDGTNKIGKLFKIDRLNKNL